MAANTTSLSRRSHRSAEPLHSPSAPALSAGVALGPGSTSATASTVAARAVTTAPARAAGPRFRVVHRRAGPAPRRPRLRHAAQHDQHARVTLLIRPTGQARNDGRAQRDHNAARASAPGDWPLRRAAPGRRAGQWREEALDANARRRLPPGRTTRREQSENSAIHRRAPHRAHSLIAEVEALRSVRHHELASPATAAATIRSPAGHGHPPVHERGAALLAAGRIRPRPARASSSASASARPPGTGAGELEVCVGQPRTGTRRPGGIADAIRGAKRSAIRTPSPPDRDLKLKCARRDHRGGDADHRASHPLTVMCRPERQPGTRRGPRPARRARRVA